MTFFTFFCLSKINEKYSIDPEIKSDIEIALGIASLLTVLIGGFIEVMQFVFEIVMAVIRVIKNLVYYIKEDRKK